MLRKPPFEPAYVVVVRWDAAPQDDEDPSNEREEEDGGDEAAEGAFLEEGFAGEEEGEGAWGA